MTVLEFEAWVSDNYEHLLGEARKVCRKYQAGDYHREMLHGAIEALLDGRGEMPPAGANPVGWVMAGVKLKLMQMGTLSDNKKNLEERFAADLDVLGADVYFDTTSEEHLKAVDARRKREERAAARKRAGRPSKHDLRLEGLAAGLIIEGSPGGIARYHYQTRRDNRLFDERAVRSLAESMHRASQAYRHFGEQGFAFSEFGQGVSK